MPPRTPPPAPSGGQNLEATIVDIAVIVIILLLLITFFKSFISSGFGGYFSLLNRLYSGSWYTAYVIVVVIVSILNAALLVFAVVAAKKFYKIKGEAVPDKEIQGHMISPQEEFSQNWGEIRGLAQSGNPSDWNMAILRADAQLDTTLDSLGYEGDTIAERLKVVDPTKLRSVDRIWSAHRLRNTIAHDPLQQYTREMIMHALDSYQLAFKDLGLLQVVTDLPEEIEESVPLPEVAPAVVPGPDMPDAPDNLPFQ